MNQANVSVDLLISYDRLPTPKKLPVPIETGQIKFVKTFQFEQEPGNPVFALTPKLSYARPETISLKMDLSGGVVFSPGGRFNLANTRVVAECNLALSAGLLSANHVSIISIERRRLPKFVEKATRKILNRFLVPKIVGLIEFDLSKIADELAEQIVSNMAPLPLDMGGAEMILNTELTRSRDVVQFEILPEGVKLKLMLGFIPELTFEEQVHSGEKSA